MKLTQGQETRGLSNQIFRNVWLLGHMLIYFWSELVVFSGTMEQNKVEKFKWFWNEFWWNGTKILKSFLKIGGCFFWNDGTERSWIDLKACPCSASNNFAINIFFGTVERNENFKKFPENSWMFFLERWNGTKFNWLEGLSL